MRPSVAACVAAGMLLRFVLLFTLGTASVGSDYDASGDLESASGAPCTVQGDAPATTVVTLLVTREVRGLALPVSKWGMQCSNLDTCDCKGGAHRRRAYIGPGTETDLPNVVAVDCGAYFWGSGSLFATFHGNASAELFADARYDGHSLTFRDFIKGPGFLANYLERVKSFHPDQPPATVTNYEPPPVLAPFINRYTLVPLAGGETLALLSLTDPTHFFAHPDTMARLQPFRQSLTHTLTALRRLPSPPRVVACVITFAPLTPAALEAAGFPPSTFSTAREGEAALRKAVVHQLAHEAVGVHLFVLGQFIISPPVPHVVQNWAGDDVLIVPDMEGFDHGRVIQNVTVAVSPAGNVTSHAWRAIVLDCNSSAHTATRARLLALHERIEQRLGGVMVAGLDGT